MKKAVVLFVIISLLSGCFPSQKEKQQQFIQAIEQGNIQAVREYMKKEKNINFKIKHETPLDVAMRTGQRDIAAQLLKAGGKSAIMPLPPLHFAIASSLAQGNEENVKIVKQIVNEKTVREKDENNNTPLHIAAGSGNLTLVKLVCQYDVDVNAVNAHGETPLLLAVQAGNVQVVRFLYEQGANIEAVNKAGETSLYKAVERNFIDVATYLLEKGANVNGKTNIGKTPLMVAAEYGYDELVTLLLRYGADVHVKDDTGNTALSLAQYWKHENIIKQLKEKGAK
ncbi:ankyrin repeats containing protein [Anoxybacillus ayderensis]|uniref:ankyrin repeat domain-containing protein n=1 Tax=Anoxybacillus ayderensis TaxID=265546 RepID=UPI000385798E|nr:ankyrin repeat domain-containing protein [Anoxybacillus ayderensis]EPZ39673.1 ankyrin repeats containing protein [Anoxybacillus ayderensis]